MNKFHEGDRVIVNTGGDDAPAQIIQMVSYNPALRDSILVRFDNHASYWIPKVYIRSTEEEEAADANED